MFPEFIEYLNTHRQIILFSQCSSHSYFHFVYPPQKTQYSCRRSARWKTYFVKICTVPVLVHTSMCSLDTLYFLTFSDATNAADGSGKIAASSLVFENLSSPSVSHSHARGSSLCVIQVQTVTASVKIKKGKETKKETPSRRATCYATCHAQLFRHLHALSPCEGQSISASGGFEADWECKLFLFLIKNLKTEVECPLL